MVAKTTTAAAFSHSTRQARRFWERQRHFAEAGKPRKRARPKDRDKEHKAVEQHGEAADKNPAVEQSEFEQGTLVLQLRSPDLAQMGDIFHEDALAALDGSSKNRVNASSTASEGNAAPGTKTASKQAPSSKNSSKLSSSAGGDQAAGTTGAAAAAKLSSEGSRSRAIDDGFPGGAQATVDPVAPLQPAEQASAGAVVERSSSFSVTLVPSERTKARGHSTMADSVNPDEDDEVDAGADVLRERARSFVLAAGSDDDVCSSSTAAVPNLHTFINNM